eukprot:4191708-Alexandrium_andersonii.AAC.1
MPPRPGLQIRRSGCSCVFDCAPAWIVAPASTVAPAWIAATTRSGCISGWVAALAWIAAPTWAAASASVALQRIRPRPLQGGGLRARGGARCLLYTSDAADDM